MPAIIWNISPQRWSRLRAERGHIDLAGIGLSIVDEFRNCLCWNHWINDHYKRIRANHRDRCNVVDEVEMNVRFECGIIAFVGTLINSVYPSGAALATASVPRLVDAPGRSSTTKGWPSLWDNCEPIRRAKTSGGVPMGTLMITRTGHDGQSSARATLEIGGRPAAAPAINSKI